MKRCVACSVLLVFGLGLLNANSANGQVFDQFATLEGAPEDAKASLLLIQRNGKTGVFIFVKKANPDTLYTVWIRLADPSPLTGKTVSPLANPDDVASLGEVTPSGDLTTKAGDLGLVGDDGSGSDDLGKLANGFRTNGRGHGFFFARLEYPVIRGAFQFSELDEEDDDLKPVALDRKPAFSLRIACHSDGTAHGLVPDVHTPAFDWQWD